MNDRFSNNTKTPHWLMTAGPHREFKFVFTVPKESVQSFPATVNSEGLNPIHIGTVQSTPAVSLILTEGRRIDVACLRNLLYSIDGDLQLYLKEFRTLGKNGDCIDQMFSYPNQSIGLRNS
jgi:hypothetical protein